VLTWLSFANLAFWAAFAAFALTSANLFNLILLSECVWAGLYALAGIVGSVVDEASCFGLTFFILGFASVELCLGLLLLVAMRRLGASLSLARNATGLARNMAQSLSLGLAAKPRV
jgi:hypothetical protein